MAKISEHLSEHKIDGIGTCQWSCQRAQPVLKRSDAVIDEACGPRHTAMSLFPRYRRRTESERRLPPHKNTAARPSETDAISLSKSFIARKLCSKFEPV
jgi:hypothetical protein